MPKTIKLASLKPNPDNPRYITEAKFEALKRSIRDFPEMMALRPMVVDEQGPVLGGNMRLKALAELGYQDIPAAWVVKAKDLTEEQRREFVIKDNIGFGAWDWEAIGNEWSDLPLDDWGLDAWESEEKTKAKVTEDEVPEPPVDPITKPGDLWILGDHRLLCGDSTKAEDVGRLMDGAKAGMMVTDPPFGIAYKSNMKGSLPRSIEGDMDTKARDYALLMFDEDFPVACFATWHCVSPRKPRGMLIWKKNVGGMGDLTFPWSLDYEVVWVFGHGWSGHRGSSILEGETICTWNTGPAARLHPHQKPVRVMAQIIEKSSGLVFDPFLGSGTTLIAAEQLSRKCYGMEISPAYCDVIVKRWETLTGKKAKNDRQHPTA